MDLGVVRKVGHGVQEQQGLGPGCPVLCGDQVGTGSGSAPVPSRGHAAPLWLTWWWSFQHRYGLGRT